MKRKSDLYTKMVLTVIVICLIVLVFKENNVITPAHASPLQSLIESGDIKPNFDGSINVRIIESKKLDVNVDNKVEISTYRSIPVEIKDSRTIPVEVKNFPR